MGYRCVPACVRVTCVSETFNMGYSCICPSSVLCTIVSCMPTWTACSCVMHAYVRATCPPPLHARLCRIFTDVIPTLVLMSFPLLYCFTGKSGILYEHER